MAEVAELSQTLKFHMVKQKETELKCAWLKQTEALCWAGPSSWLLSPEQK